MKKTYFVAWVLLLAMGACTTKKVVNRQVETQQYGTMLLGLQTIDQFKKEPFSQWYTPEKDAYMLDKKSMDMLKKQKLGSFKIIVFLGTWCEDSHREFPRLVKILETLQYPMENMEVIAVNRKKESPGGEEGIHNIQRVPTIIVMKHGKEYGRIVEFPKSGYLEKDLLEITQKYYEQTKIFK